MDDRVSVHTDSARIDRTGTVARLSIQSAQGLNESGLRQIAGLFEQLVADRQVEAICLGGAGAVFLSGADLPFFVRSVVSGDIDRVLRFTQSAHGLLERIESCTKPVVAWVEGTARGAGVELALACHAIVASDRAKFSMPETSLGIYPGMGGTQRLPRRIGPGLAKWMIYTGSIVRSAQALEIGLIDAIRPARVSADEVVATVRRGERPRLARQTRLEVLQRFFDGHSLAQLLEPGLDQPSEPELIRAMIQLRNNGPIALRLAERLIDEGLAMTLEEGIRQELSGLRQVFATEDALSGLLTFGKSRATFVDR